MFFFEKSLGSETVEEFPLTVISSLAVGKKVTGESVKIYASVNDAEIKWMGPGQADPIVRAFKAAKQAPATQSAPVAPPTPASDDPFAQLERLGELRDKSLISDDDYEAKKAELLGRM
jgi:hypothetical protein